MINNLRKNAKKDFEKDFFKLMKKLIFGKTMENVRRHCDIKIVATNKRKKYLVPESNYYTTKWFTEKLLATEIKIVTNKPVYLGFSILELNKIDMCGFWYD